MGGGENRGKGREVMAAAGWRSKDKWKKAGQGGRIGQGWMSGRGGGDRSEGVKDEAPKQVSQGQTHRQTDRIH